MDLQQLDTFFRENHSSKLQPYAETPNFSKVGIFIKQTKS
jgi:hypothetical protein